MDANRFDRWIRTRAAATNRRSFLGWSLAAGAATALTRLHPAAAQSGGSCSYTVTLTSSTTSGATVSGTLVIDIGNGGAIDTGSLSLTGQTSASIVGQATGAALELLASLDDGSILSLTGFSDSAISGCSSPILGLLANADSNQLGTWAATPENTAPTTGPVQPPQPAVPTSTPTPTPASAPTTCDPPKMICGQNCCPAGADCLANGACECPSGTEECGIACFPSCADGVTPLDPTTCLCPTG
jgi:hypothetical protein